MNAINLQGSPRVKHQIVGTIKPKAILRGYLRMPTITKLEQRKALNATENGSYEILPDENRTLSSVSVNVDVPIPEGYIDPEGTAIITSNGIHDITHYEFARVDIPERKEEQEKTVEITENGTTEILPDGDKVISKATVNVNVPIPDGYIKPEGSMDINENGTFDVTEKAEVNVQVVAKPEKPYIDSSKLKYGANMFSKDYGTDLSLLENLDTSEMVNISSMFKNRKDLTAGDIEHINCKNFDKVEIADNFMDGSVLPCDIVIDMPNVKSLRVAFSSIRGATGNLTLKNTNKCEDFYLLIWNSQIKIVKELDTSSGKNFQQFMYSSEVETIDSELDFSNATNVNYAFHSDKLINIRFKAISVFNDSLSFATCPKLSVESLLSILNALSDNTELDTTYKVTLGSANLAKLTEEQKEIAYNKNIFLA